MYANFDSSINTQSEEYQQCLKADNPKYLRSMPSGCTPEKFINFIRSLYEKNNPSNIKPKAQNHIPKIIHQIWFGTTPMPAEYKNFQKSWHYKHPSWKYVLWTEELLKSQFKNGLFNQKLFVQVHQNGNFAKMFDIARYEILYEFGGLYADCDCECFKSFDILTHTYDFFAGLEHLYNGLVIGNALMGSIPKHPIIKQCLKNIKEYENKTIDFKYWKGFSGYTPKVEEEFATTLVTTGPILLSKSVWQIADKTENRDIIFPPTYFFPFAEYKKCSIKPETFSCHYFKGIWKKSLQQKYKTEEENLIGRKNETFFRHSQP